MPQMLLCPLQKNFTSLIFLELLGAKLYQLFNSNATELGKNSVRSAYLQYNTLKKGLWKYQVVRAVKDH